MKILILGAILCSMSAVVNSLNAQGLTFTTNVYAVGNGPLVGVADVNGDGRLDLLSLNYNSTNLTVLTNNGFGGFGYYATLATGTNPTAVVVADMNGDGKKEMVVANYNNGGLGTLTVLTNNGTGFFDYSATLTVGSGPQYLVAADVNGDGKLDLICANWTNPGTVTVLTNNGAGNFGFNATLTVGKNPDWVIADDLNGDGYVDIVTCNYNDNTLTVLTNNGAGKFGFNATLATGKTPQCVIAVDVNGDAKPDLVCANVGTNTLSIFTNNGHGMFGFNTDLTVGGKPFTVVAADLNGSGKLDLISGNGGLYPAGNGYTLTILTNNGGGIFSSNATLTVGSTPYWITTADVNADGRPDLVAANFKDNTLSVLLNTTIFPPAANQPSLIVREQGKMINVVWPSSSSGWSLQESPSLSQTIWLPSGFAGYTVADDGTNKSLTMPAAGNRFFRLLHP